MALLSNPSSGRRILLQTWHAFGRRQGTCRTVLESTDVSKVHAIVRWNQSRWEIQDQSRNGTLLDGARLARDRWVPLAVGCDISMGDSPDAQWTVLDLAPPMNCAYPIDTPDRAVQLVPCGVFLPPDGPMEVHVHCLGGQWFAESPAGAEPLSDGSTLVLGGRRWELSFCLEQTRNADSTREARNDIVLRFELSQDEEHARLALDTGAGSIDLGERIHHYSLATLARLRFQDAKRGVGVRSQGWVTTAELARMLGVDVPYVNIQVFRARQQVAETLRTTAPAPLLVERRRGEMRLGDYGFTVQRGSVNEGGLLRGSTGELMPL